MTTQSKGTVSAGEGLTAILEIAKQQRCLLARGDLDAMLDLQAKRQQLLVSVQTVDEPEGDARRMLSEILRLDREMECLLSMELLDIKEQMKTVASLRKLLRSRSSAGTGPPGQLSERV